MGPADDQREIGRGIAFPGLDGPVDAGRIGKQRHLQPGECTPVERPPRLAVGLDCSRASQRHHPGHAAWLPGRPRQPSGSGGGGEGWLYGRSAGDEHQPATTPHPGVHPPQSGGSGGSRRHGSPADDDRVGTVIIEAVGSKPGRIGDGHDPEPRPVFPLQQARGSLSAGQVADHQQHPLSRLQRRLQLQRGEALGIVFHQHAARWTTESHPHPGLSRAIVEGHDLGSRRADQLAIRILHPDSHHGRFRLR